MWTLRRLKHRFTNWWVVGSIPFYISNINIFKYMFLWTVISVSSLQCHTRTDSSSGAWGCRRCLKSATSHAARTPAGFKVFTNQLVIRPVIPPELVWVCKPVTADTFRVRDPHLYKHAGLYSNITADSYMHFTKTIYK